MNDKTFEAALKTFKVVRSREYQGTGCKPLTAEEARQFRATEAAKRAQEEVEEQKRVAARRQRGQDDVNKGLSFYAKLAEELEEAGYTNVPAVVKEFKNNYEERISTCNLEELEGLLRSIPL